MTNIGEEVSSSEENPYPEQINGEWLTLDLKDRIEEKVRFVEEHRQELEG